MNIVLVSAFFRPHVGGVEVYTEQVARELAARGHRVLVLTSLLPGQAARFEEAAEGYMVLRLESGFLMGGRFPYVRATSMNRFLLAAVASFRPDAMMIGARFYPLCVLGAALAQRVGVVPLVVEHVSAYLTVNRRLADAALHAYEHAMACAMRLFPAAYYGVSRASAAWLRTFGIRARGVLSNAVDVRRFADGDDGRRFRGELGAGGTLVVFAGRLTPEKGVRTFLAAAEAMGAWPGVRFAVAGEGPLEDEVRAAAERLPQLVFAGRLDEAGLAAFMQAADVMCLPSRSEGMPTALLEAGAARTAAVLTRVGGVDELVPDARFGVVLPDRSVEALCGAILFLHEDSPTRRSMAERLHERVVSGFTWEATADALLAAAEEQAAAQERQRCAGGAA